MELLQQLISGIAQGCVYALIALGFVLIYKATETVNFAQGELLMLGAFVCLVLMKFAGLSYGVAVVVTTVGMGGFGVLLERVAIRPILGQPQFAVVMLTIGLGYIARGLISMAPEIGTETNSLDVPYKGMVWKAGGLVLSAEHIVIILVTVFLCLALYALFKFTKVGIAMQASSQISSRPITWGYRSSGSTVWPGACRRRWRPAPGFLWRPSPSCT